MAPDMDQQDQLSLTDAIHDSFESNDKPELDLVDNTEAQGERTTRMDGAPTLPPEAPWEPPAWTKMWKPAARDALGRFAQHPELKDAFDPVRSQLEEQAAYQTRKEQEAAEYRKRTDPVYNILAPYEQRYRLQGQTLEQGVQQLIGAAEFLGSDPDQAFPWLAQTYRPRDPAGAIRQLASSWGVDMDQALQDAPYIDPTVQQLISPLQQELQQVRSIISQQQAGQVRQQEQALLGEIAGFENAKDEQGNALHPHFAEVFDDMVMLIQMGRATDLPTAYKLATQFNPTLAEATQAELAKKAREKALEEATTRSETTERAERASRNLRGKGREAPNLNLSIKEGFDKALQQLGS